MVDYVSKIIDGQCYKSSSHVLVDDNLCFLHILDKHNVLSHCEVYPMSVIVLSWVRIVAQNIWRWTKTKRGWIGFML